MRKHSTRLIAIFVVTVFLMSGCAPTAAPAATQAPEAAATAAPAETTAAPVPDAEPLHLVFATMGVGTGAYAQASLIANLFLDNLPEGSAIDVQPISPGGYSSAYLFQDDQINITTCNTAPAKLAYEEGLNGKAPVKNIRAIVGAFSEAAAVLAFRSDYLKENNITSLKDAVDQKLPIRIGTGTIGTLDEYCLRCILNAYGCTYDDVKSWGGQVNMGGGDQNYNMLKDSKLDMVIDHTSSASSSMAEASMTNDLTFGTFDEAFLKQMEALGFTACSIPADTWKNQTNQIDSFGAPDMLCCSDALSDDLAYLFAKLMCENREFLLENFASFAPFDPATTWENVGGLPLHPGAERYYKEAGYMPAS